MTALYNTATGYNRAAIMQYASAQLKQGLFGLWKVTPRQRWALCIKAAWAEAKRAKQSAEYEAYQADLAAKIAAHNARYESDEVIAVEPRQLTAQEMIDAVYSVGTAD